MPVTIERSGVHHSNRKAETADKPRVLIVSHGHPDINAGGGEIASYNLHHMLNESGEFSSVFLGRHNEKRLLHGGTPFSGTGRPGEVLFQSAMADWFYFSQADRPRVWRDFREALSVIKPDVVHFHHYVHLGVELIREVKNFDASVPIVLTLHEYFGICHNHGQMVKTGTNALCYRSTPADCSRCFPERSAQDFMLRERFIKSHFDLIDRFIAPSAFLKQRYVQWGIDGGRIQVTENLLQHPKSAPDTTATNLDTSAPIPGMPLRFAYFGQINHFKGVDILLDAFALLPEGLRANLQLDIHGNALEKQSRKLQARIRMKVDRLAGQATLHGAYRPEELGSLMSSADWMVVPSRWWENSPMVILEAKRYGVPVICSNIGGMSEKIDPGSTGLHFLVGRADSLAGQLAWAAQHRQQLPTFRQNIRAQYDHEGAGKQHRHLYHQLIKNSIASTEQLKAA